MSIGVSRLQPDGGGECVPCLLQIAALILHAAEGEKRAGIFWVELQRIDQTALGFFQLSLAVPHHSEKVVAECVLLAVG